MKAKYGNYAVTSILSYYEEEDSGRNAYKRDIVLRTIKARPGASNADLGRILGWEINRITPRTNELMKLGLIERKGTKKDIYTGKTVYYWVAKKEAV